MKSSPRNKLVCFVKLHLRKIKPWFWEGFLSNILSLHKFSNASRNQKFRETNFFIWKSKNYYSSRNQNLTKIISWNQIFSFSTRDAKNSD